MSLERIPGTPAAGAQPLSDAQRAQLKKLHEAAQQLESVFVGMLFKEMRKTESDTSLTGKISNAESTFRDMLDQKRSEELAKTGSFGIARVLEEQLRASVLGSQGAAPAAPVAPPVKPADLKEKGS